MTSTLTSQSHSPRPHAAAPGTRPPRQAPTVPTWVLKLIMSVTGVIWAVFVVVHLFGNLKVYGSAEGFDGYAHWLREVGYPLIPHEGILWALRVVLVVSMVAHLVAMAMLRARASRARGPKRAKVHGPRAWAARMMLPTGVLIIVCLVIHLLDFTLGVQPVAPPEFLAGAPYANLVAGFSRPWAAVTYVVWMVALAVHVLHGALLATNDVGATGVTLRKVAVWVGVAFAVAVFLGNASIPVAVQMGVL